MNHFFNINNNAVVVFTNKLEKLRRSALPNAIRNTLNSAAFDVKQKSMPVSADKHFINRKQNFFKANSKVVMAQGYDIKTMRATVGFTPTNAKYNNFAVKELEQQEHSGTIDHRTFVPLDQSRSGDNNASQVLPSNRLKAIKKIIDTTKGQNFRNKKEQFIKAAIHAGKGGFVIGNFTKKTLFRITSIKRDNNGKTIISKKALYSYDKGRGVKIKKATHFMREASMVTVHRMDKFFAREAQRQIQRTFR